MSIHNPRIVEGSDELGLLVRMQDKAEAERARLRILEEVLRELKGIEPGAEGAAAGIEVRQIVAKPLSLDSPRQ